MVFRAALVDIFREILGECGISRSQQASRDFGATAGLSAELNR